MFLFWHSIKKAYICYVSVGSAWLGPRGVCQDTEKLQEGYSSKRRRGEGDNHRYCGWGRTIGLEAQRDAILVRPIYHGRQWHGARWAGVEENLLGSWIQRLQNNTSSRCPIDHRGLPLNKTSDMMITIHKWFSWLLACMMFVWICIPTKCVVLHNFFFLISKDHCVLYIKAHVVLVFLRLIQPVVCYISSIVYWYFCSLQSPPMYALSCSPNAMEQSMIIVTLLVVSTSKTRRLQLTRVFTLQWARRSVGLTTTVLVVPSIQVYTLAYPLGLVRLCWIEARNHSV